MAAKSATFIGGWVRFWSHQKLETFIRNKFDVTRLVPPLPKLFASKLQVLRCSLSTLRLLLLIVVYTTFLDNMEKLTNLNT